MKGTLDEIRKKIEAYESCKYPKLKSELKSELMAEMTYYLKLNKDTI